MTQQYALSVTDLKKIYKNDLVALKGITLNVAKGDFFALLGPNGAGKSTTIGIISTLIKKSAGKIAIFGYDLDKNAETTKSLIGLVPQEVNFNPFEKVLQILINKAGYHGISQKHALHQAEMYLKKLELWDKRDTRAFQLSGGMKRRLLIAKALVHEPQLLILDEPTAGVDVELRYALWELLKELNARGTTIILTTHYLEEAEQLCKNVAIIDHGEIIENTDIKTLLHQSSIQTLILDLEHPLTKIPELVGWNVHLVEPHTLEVRLEQSQLLNNLFADLSTHHLNVISIRNKTNRLEELFIRLINHGKELA